MPLYRRRRRRARPLEDASDIVYRALCQSGLTDQARRLRIFQQWCDAVGPQIAARTMPVQFSKGVLLVKAASPTWQNELMFLKAGIVAKLNSILGKPMVKHLKVISGQMTPQRQSDAGWQCPKPSARDVALANAIAEPIPDPTVRGAFARLVALNRARASATAAGQKPTPAPQM